MNEERPFSLPAATALATLAGAAGLVVELVWMRLLSLAYGSASLAAGGVVAALMLGMALGSAAAGRARAPSRWLGIALLSLAAGAAVSSPALLALSELGAAGIALGALFMIAFSLPMGAFVPLLVASTVPRDPRTAGRLYAFNTLGAALGVLVVGFWLLPALGNWKTLAVGAIALALPAAFCFTRRTTSAVEAAPSEKLTRPEALVLAAYAASALAAMASEVAWIRALTLSIGSSTYAFTIVLGVYIGGLGIGAAVMARLLPASPGRAFGILQLAIAASCLLALQVLGWLPELFGRVLFDRVSSLGSFSLAALFVSAVAILPPALLTGGCFPLVISRLPSSPARASGLSLAAATAGSMLGALVGSFVAIPALRLETTMGLALMIHAALGVLTIRRPAPVLAAAGIALLLAVRPPWDVRVVQSGPYIYGARAIDPAEREKLLFAEDDPVASVSVIESSDGTKMMRIDGKTDASMNPEDVGTQMLLAHLPMALHGRARRVAVIGLGSGMTVGSALAYGPESLDCYEISPAVVRASRFFDADTGRPLDDPRVRLHVADARRALRGATDRFDVIISEPSNLWIAGMAGLFTEEFYRTCESRLADGGLVCQWIHAYSMTPASFRDALATFLKVFPNSTVWEIWVAGDYLLVGSRAPVSIDAAALEKSIAAPAVSADLRRIGIRTVRGLLCDLVAVAPRFADARIQTDDGMHLEFSAPIGFYGRVQNAALEVLGDAEAAPLAAVVRGRPVDWIDARTVLREGVKARWAGMNRVQVMGLFVGAHTMNPEDRQARWFMEDRVQASMLATAQMIRDGKAKAALAELDLIPPESRSYVAARIRMIGLLTAQKAPPGAIAAEFRNILAVEPGHESAAAELTALLLVENLPPEAEKVAAAAVTKTPGSARLRVMHGRALAALKKNEEARAEWREASRLDPSGRWGDEARRLLE